MTENVELKLTLKYFPCYSYRTRIVMTYDDKFIHISKINSKYHWYNTSNFFRIFYSCNASIKEWREAR